MSIKLSDVLRQAEEGVLMHWCVGCNSRHHVNVGKPNGSGAVWTWNGDVEKPTFSPSVHITIGPWEDEDGFHPKQTSCHYFVRDGNIEYLNDCQHELRGQTVPLTAFPEWVK